VNLAAALIITVNVLAQAPEGSNVPPPATAPAAAAGGAVEGGGLQVSSALDFVLKGGWPMVPIGVCSLFALAIIIERAMVIRRSRVVPRGFVRRVMDVANDRAKALELCRQNRSPIARIFSEALKRQHEPPELMEKHVEEVGARELTPLRTNMRLLSGLPQVATMLGLLGTVFGMIKTFQAVAATSEALGKTESLAKGIFEAWTCTAGGLFVAIPVIIAYQWLMGKIDSIAVDVDRTTSEFVDVLEAKSPAGRSRAVESSRMNAELASDGVAAPASA
jgi:biopolymer transport protein ExbB